MKRQKGFAIIELLIIVIVLALVVLLGVYAWSRNHTSSSSGNVGTSYAHPAGWLVYTSTHSSLHFSYPSGWRLIHNAIPSGSFFLEDVSLVGPNNFVMRFILEKTHANPELCMVSHYGQTIKMNSLYTLASTLYDADRSQIESLNLVPTSDTAIYEGATGCGAGFAANAVGSTMDFTFSAFYAQAANLAIPIPKTANTYFNLPEVQVAKTIFGSIK